MSSVISTARKIFTDYPAKIKDKLIVENYGWFVGVIQDFYLEENKLKANKVAFFMGKLILPAKFLTIIDEVWHPGNDVPTVHGIIKVKMPQGVVGKIISGNILIYEKVDFELLEVVNEGW